MEITEDIEKAIELQAKPGFRSLIRTYFGYETGLLSSKSYLKKTARSLVIDFLPPGLASGLVVSQISSSSEIDLGIGALIELSDLINGTLPTLLGLTLSAYAIFTGFGGSQFVKQIAKFEPKKTGLYTKTGAIFAVGALFQMALVLLGILISVLAPKGLPTPSFLSASNLNQILLFIGYAGLFWSVWYMRSIIVSIFNLTQVFHLFLFVEKVEGSGDNPSNE